MNYNIINYDSSNIIILNNIEIISGTLMKNGVDIIQSTSNYIESTSNIIINEITKLNADNITNGSVNKFIKNDIYNDNLTVNSNLYINGTETIINSKLYTSNIIEILNNTQNTAFSINQYDTGNDVFNASNLTDEIFTITYDGSVGIGVKNPVKKLDVLGDLKLSGSAYINSNLTVSGTTTIDKIEIEHDGEDTAFLVTNNTGDIFIASNINSKVFTITNDGKVGIGNTTPVYTLDINNVDGIKLPSGNISQRPNPSTLGVIRYNTENNEFEGYGAGNSWGSLGGVKNIQGDTYITADSNDDLKFYTNTNIRMIINNTGDIGIGNINPSKKLEVAGQIAAHGKITSYYSDERLKTYIDKINEPLELIKKLNGFYYKPNELARSFGIKSNNREIGLSAQEVNKVFPELVDLAPFDTIKDENDNIVSKSGENYLTISYERLMPVIIESIKQLTNEIEILKIENKFLKEKII